MIATPTTIPPKLLKFASGIKNIFINYCGEDHWNLLAVESPEVEMKEKLGDGESDAESNEADEDEVEDVPEFDLGDLSVRYWAFFLLQLASLKSVVSKKKIPFLLY